MPFRRLDTFFQLRFLFTFTEDIYGKTLWLGADRRAGAWLRAAWALEDDDVFGGVTLDIALESFLDIIQSWLNVDDSNSSNSDKGNDDNGSDSSNNESGGNEVNDGPLFDLDSPPPQPRACWY